MAKYIYVVKDSSGKSISDLAEAVDQDTLVEHLQKQGYFVVSIKPQLDTPAVTQPKRQKIKEQRVFTHNKVNLDDLLVFSRQLGTMLDSGVSLMRSLDVIISQAESKQFFNILIDIKKQIEQGASLSASLAKYPKTFNQFWVSLVEVGEASGNMPKILEKLSFYLEQEAAFNSSIITAIVYPAILFVVACGAIAFFAFFVGPRFEEVFKSMGARLPWLTLALLAVFRFIKIKIFMLLGIAGVILLAVRKYIQTDSGRLVAERFLFNLPVFGRVIKLIVIERFASQMAVLVDSGVPILQSLDITQRLVGNRTCELIVADIKNAVREGALLVAPMIKSNFFPPMAIQMIMVGEETGELSKMLQHVAKFYQTGVETFLKRFGTMIEPFMLVFMGGIIGVIIIAMFLPLLNVVTAGGVK